MNRLMNLADAAELIRSGAFLSLAGPESALDALPKGNWVAGNHSLLHGHRRWRGLHRRARCS